MFSHSHYNWHLFISLLLFKNQQHTKAPLSSDHSLLETAFSCCFQDPNIYQHAVEAKGHLPVGAAQRELPVSYYRALHRLTDVVMRLGRLRTRMLSFDKNDRKAFQHQHHCEASYLRTNFQQ